MNGLTLVPKKTRTDQASTYSVTYLCYNVINKKRSMYKIVYYQCWCLGADERTHDCARKTAPALGASYFLPHLQMTG